MLPFTPFTTTAAEVRTGMIIKTPWTSAHTTLEVEYVTHEHFVSPEGAAHHVIRFTGWELFDGKPIFYGEERAHRVLRGWGTRATEDIHVEGDLRSEGFGMPITFLPLSGRADVETLEAELADFLASISQAAA